MERHFADSNIEIWGGLECTLNRVGENYFDQLQYAGHYQRDADIELIASLGIKKLRYPLLWEKHEPEKDGVINWSECSHKLDQIRLNGMEPIAGLVHHGSGPTWVNMADDSFSAGLAQYAEKVANRFPWINYYTPVNEPLTTARFCGLYGVWHPHLSNSLDFARILMQECKATILAMQAIRKINPDAKLVQTEDLGKTHSTELLKYQADYENSRRWITFDLLCGRVNKDHRMWHYLRWLGITNEELNFFIDNPYPPDIIGINHYLTSERHLDENLDCYPEHTHGGNGQHNYADVEAVRVGKIMPSGPYQLLKETFDRYHIPVAVTEVHLHCTREEQMRWMQELWMAGRQLKAEGYPMLAITPWALLGSFGWNKLLTQPNGDYEAGIFNVRSGKPRATVLAKMVQSYSKNEPYQHPVLETEGWWKRHCRVIYCHDDVVEHACVNTQSQPLLIVGKSGTLGSGFAKMCDLRGIHYHLLGRDEMDVTNLLQIEKVILEKKPWAIVNTAGYVRVDDAEAEQDNCFLINTFGAENLAILCEKYGVKLLTFSTDLVFDGSKSKPYTESDPKAPLNIYGRSKALAEQSVLRNNAQALIIRTSAFFGPWDKYNFLQVALDALRQGKPFSAPSDVYISPTYVPDLIQNSLDLLLDDESGIWHMTNHGAVTWAELALAAAEIEGHHTKLVNAQPLKAFGLKAMRPQYSVLSSEREVIMPPLEDALGRYFRDKR